MVATSREIEPYSGVIKLLVADVWLEILENIDILTLNNVKNTCMQMRRDAQYVYNIRYIAMLYHYFDDAETTSLLLDDTRSIISGSSALQFCLNQGAWTPADLDIYTTVTGFQAVKHHVNSRGYMLVREDQFYGTESRMQRVAKYQKGVLKIDVVQSEDDLAVSPLDGFWGSPPMNVVTRRGYTVAYPKLTFYDLGILLHTSTTSQHHAIVRALVAKYKYERRSFIIVHKPSDIPPSIRPHLQTRDMCTHRIRWFGDSDCAMGVFITGRDSSNSIETAQWIAGGAHCNVDQCTHTFPVSEESRRVMGIEHSIHDFTPCCEYFSSRVSIAGSSLFSAM